MINENAILKTASVNDNPAADQIRIRINIINRDRDVLVCVSLLSNVLFLCVSYLRICFVTGQQTVLLKFSYMLYMQVCVFVLMYFTGCACDLMTW